MFQCLGLAGESEGGCGEDWWHPECIVGLGRSWKPQEKATVIGNGHVSSPPASIEAEANHEEEDEHEELPPGFPKEDDFETFICYKCVDANPWIKRYAASSGFLPPVMRKDGTTPAKTNQTSTQPANRLHAEGEQDDGHEDPSKHQG